MTHTYYHATDFSNYSSVIQTGLKRGIDGYIYLTETPQDALKFLRIRGLSKILVLEVQLEEDMVEESFDHSEAFFKCRAFMYPDDIQLYDIKNATMYEFD